MYGFIYTDGFCILITISPSVTIPFQRMLWLKFLTSRQIMAPEATKSNKTPAIIIIISFLRIFNMQSWFPCSPMSSIYMYLYRSCSIRNLKLHSCCLPLSALVFFPDYLTIYTNFLDEGSFLFSKSELSELSIVFVLKILVTLVTSGFHYKRFVTKVFLIFVVRIIH